MPESPPLPSSLLCSHFSSPDARPVQSPPVPTSTVGADGLTGPVSPVGTPEVVASGLQVPWSIVRLDCGSTLISERDRGVVVELTADGELRDVGAIDGRRAEGEGGLLGLAVLDERVAVRVLHHRIRQPHRAVRARRRARVVLARRRARRS